MLSTVESEESTGLLTNLATVHYYIPVHSVLIVHQRKTTLGLLFIREDAEKRWLPTNRGGGHIGSFMSSRRRG